MKKQTLILAAAIAALLAGPAAAAPDQPFNSLDITGAGYARGFDLPDHTGKRRTLADFKGKVVAVFFGFTQCPDACPTALAQIADLIRRLGPDGARVQGIFVTVDPQRDTPEVLAQYVKAFHPSLIALRGTPREVEKTAKEFRVYYGLNRKPGDGGSYTVDHSATIFVFDPRGRARLLYSSSFDRGERVLEDFRRLLGS
jgi:protein SCO1/2